jgi:serpin B
MKSIGLNSMLLGLTLVATSGCSSNGDRPMAPADAGTIRLEVVLGSNNSLNSIHWQLTCTPTPAAIASGDWDTSHSATVSGVIGGVPAGDSCTLVLTGTDTTGQNAGLTNNCKGTVANISPGATAAVSIVCTDSLTPVAPGTTSSIGVSATVATVQGTHQCAGIAAYSASPAEVFVGSSIAFGASTTALYDGATATTSWSSPTDTGFSVIGATASYPCHLSGTQTIALSVQDSFVGCPASTANFNVACTVNTNGGSGGTSSVAVSEAKSTQIHETQPNITDTDYQSVISATNQLGFDLFHKVASNSANLVFSPTSMVYALVMTYLGANGATQTQMASVLRDSLASGVYHTGLNRLSMALASRNIAPHASYAAANGQLSVTLSLVDAMWAQRDYPLQSAYLDALAINYNAGVQLLDFVNQPEASRVFINQWVASQTANRILDLLPPGSVSSWTRLVLTNALYFKGSWQIPLSPNDTRNSSFTQLDGTMHSVPTMHADLHIPYTEGVGYQFVQVPYDGNALSMLLVLPAVGQFASVRDSLSQGWLNDAMSALSSNEVILALPKFSFTWGAQDFAPALQALGMSDAFQQGLADFSGMETAHQFFLSGVIQKAFIGVDEYGTEAAAATAAELAGAGSNPPPPKQFVVDRPFLFFIRDVSGAVLFAGQVLDPTQQ